MHLRAEHAEDNIPTLRQFVRDHPLGLFTTAIQSSTYPLLQTSHIPFVLDIDDESNTTNLGRLRGHMARANPQVKAMVDTLTDDPQPNNVLEQEVLVLFNSPAHHYVTPKFYTETKPSTGKVAPTWNYSAVQVYGRARIFFDGKSDETSDFIQGAVEALSHQSETGVMGFTGGDAPTEWKVADAPERYVNILKKAIVGIEIEIDRMDGKFKMSQEMPKGDREGVIKGFERLAGKTEQEIAQLVRERGELRDAAKAKAR